MSIAGLRALNAKPPSSPVAVIFGFLLSMAPVQAASLELDPAAACATLSEEGLGARGGYRKNAGGGYRCNSIRKTLVAGNSAQNEIRFSALGDASLVRELRLELTVRSRGDTQRSHRQMSDYATALAQNALSTELPPEAVQAMLSGVSGQWANDGIDYRLRRDTVADGLYALRLTIR